METARLFDRTAFFLAAREGLGRLSQGQVDGAETLLGLIETDPQRPADLRVLAYALATAWHETGHTWSPCIEKGTRAYIDSRYDPVRASTEARRRTARSMGS